MTPFNAWVLASRPKTLSIAVAPVMVGVSLAWADGFAIDWWVALATLSCALLIQVAVNLHNDVADYERGMDGPERLGPERAAAQGWLSARAIYQGISLCLIILVPLGLYLVWVGGWPILACGLASIAAGSAYSGGRRPVSASALGEFLVFLFFGLAAVLGGYYLQALDWRWDALLLGAALGAPAAAVLLVNNTRDRESDAKHGRRTFSVIAGVTASHWLYAGLMVAALLFCLGLFLLRGDLRLLLPGLLLPWLVLLVRRFFSWPIDSGFNRLLAQTAQWQLALAMLLSLALIWHGSAARTL